MSIPDHSSDPLVEAVLRLIRHTESMGGYDVDLVKFDRKILEGYPTTLTPDGRKQLEYLQNRDSEFE